MSAAEFIAKAEKYGGTGFLKRSALRIREGAGVFEQILGSGKYRHALEIGTYRGVTAAYMAQFCERVTTIDLIEGQNEKLGPPVDRKAFWASMGIDNIDLHLVSDEIDKAAIIASLDFDFAFIDGDHRGSAPARDFALVKACGAVLLHDCDGKNGVTHLVRSLPEEQVERMDIFAFWRSHEQR
jgi:predicted O-methyltransferase YrrM